MHPVWVDRDGTGYGPYTQEEFLAYVESGHIVARDRARIGERGEFEPVPAILARLSGMPRAAEAPAALPESSLTARTAAAGQAADPATQAGDRPPAPEVGATALAVEAPVVPMNRMAAGFWRRAGAYAIDLLIGYAVAWAVSTIAGLGLSMALDRGIESATIDILRLIPLVLLLTVWPIYFALAESSAAQATLGKRAMGLIVTDCEGLRITFLRALGRHVAALLNYLSLMIGWVFVAIPVRKRGFHDYVAGTCVVCARPDTPSAWVGFAIWLLVPIALLALMAGGYGAFVL